MRNKPDPKLIRQFEELIDAVPASENALQDFLEKHTEFLVTPFLRHNQSISLNCIISKLKVGPWNTDFVYLSKSTDGWNLILVELKRPDKQLFHKKSLHLTPHGDFNKALAQIQSWRDEWDKNPEELLRALRPLLVPVSLERPSITAYYVMIIGRKEQYVHDDAKRRRLDSYRGSHNLQVMTFDTLLDNYKAGGGRKLFVLSPHARGYRLKYMDSDYTTLFGQVGEQSLVVSKVFEKRLKAQGYDMDSWRKGKSLSSGTKRTMEEDLEDADKQITERFIALIKKSRRAKRR